MRMSREDAARNRSRVVKTASELFRKEGYDGIGIAALMKASGMTNGAFSKQFESKDALIAEATAHALAENGRAWDKVLAKAGDDPLGDLMTWYLSDLHRDRRDLGCTFAALAAEAPRHGEDVRRAFDDALRQAFAKLSAAAGEGEDADQARAIRQLSRLVGALILARAVGDPDLAEDILAANRTPE